MSSRYEFASSITDHNGNGKMINQQVFCNRRSSNALTPHRRADLSSGNAIEVRDVYMSYKNSPVLTGLNLTVPRGAIYGLLGPSGCGKTTLLRCILGRLSIKSGCIKVYGCVPGQEGSGVPGKRVGYMPQENALYEEFTLRETLQYYGRIFNMAKAHLEKRIAFLILLLYLPIDSRFVQTLSGGQKRRLSFAVALLQEPPLLILDEPTVGVDPLLRRNVWGYLATIANAGQTTIIFTTHYIEEARQADMVSFMRNGYLLAEDSPEKLIMQHKLPTLEAVFFKLCRDETLYCKGRLSSGSSLIKDAPISNQDINKQNDSTYAVQSKTKEVGCSLHRYFPRFSHIYALTIKNFIRMGRNVGFLVFQFFLPAFQIGLFCLAIGRLPTHVTIAVHNAESNVPGGINLPQRFLDQLDQSELDIVDYADSETALQSVKDGKAWAALLIKENFTANLLARMFQCVDVDDLVINAGLIHVTMDKTNQPIAFSIQDKLLRGFMNLSSTMMTETGFNPLLGQLPLVFENPIYGSLDPHLTEFMAPGIILSIIYHMAVALTAFSFVGERKEGLIDRSWVAGVSSTEVMLAHFLTQFCVVIVQILLSLIMMIIIFNIPCHGSPLWVVTIILIQGMTGMAFGLVISALCDEQSSAIMFALGSFHPNIFLSGILWPLEGMPKILHFVSLAMPQTYPAQALRDLLSKGKDMTYTEVWVGHLISVGWMFLFLIAAWFITKFRR